MLANAWRMTINVIIQVESSVTTVLLNEINSNQFDSISFIATYKHTGLVFLELYTNDSLKSGAYYAKNAIKTWFDDYTNGQYYGYMDIINHYQEPKDSWVKWVDCFNQAVIDTFRPFFQWSWNQTFFASCKRCIECDRLRFGFIWNINWG